MSRVPRSTTSSTSLRGQYRASSSHSTTTKTPTSTSASTGSPSKLRVPGSRKPTVNTTSETIDTKATPTKERLSLREQIALKRAEAKKAHTQNRESDIDAFNAGEFPSRVSSVKDEDSSELGRWGVRETIERARGTGNLNLSSRSLVCIPSCLYEIHLGITPTPLPSITEPDYPEEQLRRSKQSRQQPSWYEAQDLVVLKAWSNEIVELQQEIALFGSLKLIDLHSNCIESLPSSMTSLSSLTSLDLSHNKLKDIPPSLFSLPSLLSLNISHNSVSVLPFSQFNCPLNIPDIMGAGSLYAPEIKRAETPLPKLHTLDAGHNELSSEAIDHSHLPRALIHLTISHNPLGRSSALFSSLATLPHLRELYVEGADIDDDSFDCNPPMKFPKLRVLDLHETRVTERAPRSFFSGSDREPNITFDITSDAPSDRELRIIVGKKVVKEAWEIEAERHYLRKKKSMMGVNNQETASSLKNGNLTRRIEKEEWEIKAEQGLTTEGGRRRARAAAAALSAPPVPPLPMPPSEGQVPGSRVIEKEAWEIEAEQGLLTEGGRRRARAQEMSVNKSREVDVAPKPPSVSLSLANSTYYSASALSLVLPSSAPPTRGHGRTFSLMTSVSSGRRADDLLVPTPSLPLNVIAKQNFASTLRILILNNRRADSTFSFPSASSMLPDGSLLPQLDELHLEGCSLSDMVTISQETDEGGSPILRKQNVLEALADAFPTISLLNLSYNSLSSECLSSDALMKLLVPQNISQSASRKGLKVLRLCGNKLNNLASFENIGALFKGNRQVPEWRLEELDVRDNDISKLPVLLGLLPLDVFLVDGNTFRVPPRKVWEREGTKGLLSWLRGRIE